VYIDVYLFLLSIEAAFDQGPEVTVDDSLPAFLSAAISHTSLTMTEHSTL